MNQTAMHRIPTSLLKLLLIIILSEYLFCACKKEDTPEMPELLLAESIAEEHPDSALSILNAIDTAALPSPADRALYALILTQAEYKSGKDIFSTDTISVAIDYYRDHDDPHRKMLSLLYLSNIQINNTLYDEAILSLLEAEKLGLELKDWFHLGFIYRNISWIYNEIFEINMSFHYSEKAVDAFKKSGNKEYWNYERINLACSYLSMNNRAEATKILDSVLTQATIMNDSVTIIDAIYQRAYVKMWKQDWEGAITDFKTVEKCGLTFNETKDRQALMIAYERLGEIDAADSIYSLLKASKGGIYATLHTFYASRGDFKAAYNALHRQHRDQDSMLWVLFRQRVTKTSSSYEKLQFEEATLAAKKQKSKFTFILIGCLCILGITTGYFIYRKKMMNKYITSLLRDYDLLSIEFEQLSTSATTNNNNNTSTSHTDWETMFKKQFAFLDQFCVEYYQAPTLKKTAKLAKTIETTILELKNNTTFITGIFNDINKYNNNLISDLQQTQNNLTESDYLLLALLSSGLSTQAISIILAIDIQTLYVRKSRLKSKITKLNFSRKEELLALIFPDKK